ncbi:energy-coupling factor ABC transporter ATP-binding protein [Massilia sp. CF038]|uniref:energy-coupling factor ABC transporter ATP-binding protein n=1 Tax=Massilia sp. CF038 TaxID=1881045 RepID=UPI00092293AB|nr:energy-coupling factor ABC transporter ATP-binding protein [Massilia sp. CF038]SHG40139.1 tungstate transport system ATP-binding protein [Massilia sp. CF038]
MLLLRGLRKTLGERVLFDIDTLAVEKGRAYVLTGVNGAGKSTLLRVLAGLEPASCASISWQGEALRLAPYPACMRTRIVYVHQHPVLFSTSVAHNVAFGLLARGMPKAAAAAEAQAAMEWAGVAHLQASDPAVLSGGEKQRVALARAKVLRPDLLLLDEPTANLDGAAREQVIALIPALIDAGNTVIMACHDRDLINLPGVRRFKLRDGQLEFK